MNPLLAQTAGPSAESGVTEALANLSVGSVALIALVLTVIRLLLLNPLRPSVPGKAIELPSSIRAVAEVFESLIVALVLVFLIIRPFFVQAFYIPSESMEPTLLGHDPTATGLYPHDDSVHDRLFVNKLVYRYSEPHHGDIIVFRAPKEADMENPAKGLPPVENVLIKRCIGLPGDTIEVKKDGDHSAVWRNGEKLIEPDIATQKDVAAPYHINKPMDEPQPQQAHFGVDQYDGPHILKLGPDELFMMGDNRNDSNDSRYWGPLKRDRVIGKAAVIFFPLNRIRMIH